MTHPTLTLSSLSRETGEDPVADFISAMLTDGTYDPAIYGVSDEHIYSHRRVHLFALEYQEVQGHAPTPEQVLRRFADFPYSPTAELDWTTHEIHKHIQSRTLRKILNKASTALIDESPDDAMSILSEGISLVPWTSRQAADASDTSFYDKVAGTACPVAGKTLMEATGGILPGQLWYVGARPGRGKSWDLVGHAVAAAEAGWDVVLFSIEMSADVVMTRIHARMVGWQPNTDLIHKKVKTWFSKPGRGTIQVLDPGHVRCDVLAIERAAKPNTLILIDYVGLMQTSSGARSIEDNKFAAVISNSLHEVVLRRDVPVIAAAQLNRGAEEPRKGIIDAPPPSLNDLSQTDALGQDADLVYFIRGLPESRIREGRIVKHRTGAAGQRWYMDFQPGAGTFEEIPTSTAVRILQREEERSAI